MKHTLLSKPGPILKRTLSAFMLVAVALFTVWLLAVRDRTPTAGGGAPMALTEAEEPEEAGKDPQQPTTPEAGRPRPASPAERLLAKAEMIEEREEPGGRPGLVRRTRLVKADFIYPLLRVVETLEQDKASGEWRQVNQFEEVADHLIVTIKPGNEAEFAAAVAKIGGEIRRKLYVPHSYLVAFSPVDLGTLDRAKEALASITAVDLVAEDVIVHRHPTIDGKNL